MLDVQQELMTPPEAARWFRRSTSWLRHQPHILKLAGPRGQPLYHIGSCRAYMLGRLIGASGPELRRVQIQTLAEACGLSQDRAVVEILRESPMRSSSPRAAAGK